jgi:hypothetical protein
LLNKQVFLSVKAKYLRYSFLDLSIKIFFLCFDRLLIGHGKYFVSFIIITRFVLTSIFSITSIFGIRNNYTTARLPVKINGFLAVGTRGYLVSVLFNMVS